MSVFGQTFNSKAIEITNSDNDNYIEIIGTKIRIVPPEGFCISENTRRFTDKNSNSISISDLNGGINKNFGLFNKEKLAKIGVNLLKETFYMINGIDAMLLEGVGSNKNGKFIREILIIGDYTNTYMISAEIKQNSSKNQFAEIQKSILSAIFDPNKKCNIFDKFSFTIDTTGTSLHLTDAITTAMTLTDDGNVPSKTADKVSLTIRRSTAKTDIDEQEKKAIIGQYLALFPIEWENNEEPTPVKYAEFNGYEAIRYGKSANGKELVYLLILFDNNASYIFTGMARGNYEENISDFRKIASTIKTR